jgi:SAM-dependent methyltransferase
MVTLGSCRLDDCEPSVLYRGTIRAGAEVFSDDTYSVLRCQNTDVAFLDPAPRVDYESEAYREAYDGSATVHQYHELHDAEHMRNLAWLSQFDIRGKSVLDIGAGAGSFLDLLRGVASRTVGVEPEERYRKHLEATGHEAFPYMTDLYDKDRAKHPFDLVVSQHVIEHVPDPRRFLAEIRDLLAPNGTALIVTPNRHDLLLESVGEAYQRFFYRTAHLWYFGADGLSELARSSGLKVSKLGHRQEFGLSNMLLWLKHRAPPGRARLDWITPEVDACWRASLESTGRAGVVYLIAQRLT